MFLKTLSSFSYRARQISDALLQVLLSRKMHRTRNKPPLLVKRLSKAEYLIKNRRTTSITTVFPSIQFHHQTKDYRETNCKQTKTTASHSISILKSSIACTTAQHQRSRAMNRGVYLLAGHSFQRGAVSLVNACVN